MIKHIVLNEDDIRQVIANSFSVDKAKVYLITFTETKGYGMGEHTVTSVKAHVDVPVNEQR